MQKSIGIGIENFKKLLMKIAIMLIKLNILKIF